MLPKTTAAPSTTTVEPGYDDGDIRVKSFSSSSGSMIEMLRNLLYPDSVVDGSTTTTTLEPGDDNNGELSGSAMLVIGIVIGFVITFITAVVFAMIFRKKYRIQSLPIENDDNKQQNGSKNPCSVSIVSDGQVEIGGDVAKRQNATNESSSSTAKSGRKFSVAKSGRKNSAISTLPPPYSS